MKRKTKVALLVGMLTTGVAVAGGFGYHRSCMDPDKRAAAMTKEIAERLQLTTEQTAKLDVVKDELVAKGREFHATRDQIHDRVNQILTQPSLDQAAVLKLVQERTAVVNDSAPEIVAKLAAFYDSLDETQRSKLREQLANHLARRDEHHHGW